MEYRVKKYNGMSPGTFYAITDNEARDSGTIDFPLWILSIDTGKITEVEKGAACFKPDWMGKVEALIFANRLVFSVDAHQDLFKDKFRSVSAEGYEKGLYNVLKGKHILFLEQRAAAVKAREILLKKQRKINEELNMVNSLISY